MKGKKQRQEQNPQKCTTEFFPRMRREEYQNLPGAVFKCMFEGVRIDYTSNWVNPGIYLWEDDPEGYDLSVDRSSCRCSKGCGSHLRY